MKKLYPLTLLLALLLPSLACGLTDPGYRLNNEVRLAIFKYDREKRGPVTDLIIHFTQDEPRLRFEGQHQNGGHTVWLYSAGAEEYFALRPAQATYLYIQEINYNEAQTAATVDIYRGDGSGYQGWRLTLTRNENKGWMVTDEVEISQD